MRLLLLAVWAFASVRPDTVLILGSGGLIGSALVRRLEQTSLKIEQVRNRQHIDLRQPGALDVFNKSQITYCFFLACEVGGSKFLESSDQRVQLGIIESNIRIYQAVFPWLTEHQIPFVFSSSYLQGTSNSYGVVKRLGEQWVQQLGGLGRTYRLWNVYGRETSGPKSHVLSDWAASCVKSGSVRSRTNGLEMRQFIQVDDVADALAHAVTLHSRLPLVSDVSSGEWVTMRTAAAQLVAAADAVANVQCEVVFAEEPATVREKLSPQLNGVLHTRWEIRTSLLDGCRYLLLYLHEWYVTCDVGCGTES